MSEWNARSDSDAWNVRFGFVLSSAFAGLTLTGFDPTVSARLRLYMYIVNGLVAGSMTYTFNGDVATNYIVQDLTANGTTVNGARLTAQTSATLNTDDSQDDSAPGLYILDITKPEADEVAHIESRTAYMDASAVTVMYERHAAEWTNTVDLINLMTILFSAGNGAVAGTRIEIEHVYAGVAAGVAP